MRLLQHTAAALLCTLLLAACTGNYGGDRVIAHNPLYTLTGDTLTEGGVVVTASTPHYIESTLTRERLDSIALAYGRLKGFEGSTPTAFVGGRPWYATGDGNESLRCTTGGRLLDAVWNMSLDHVAQGSRQATFDAHGDTLALYCAMSLSLAWLDPMRTMHTLRTMVARGRVVPLGQWPLEATHLAWAEAAWNVYLATGNRQWLAEAHDVIQATLNDDMLLLADNALGLLHGATALRGSDFYPSWMQPADVAQSMPLLSSVLAYRASAILDEADEELEQAHRHGTDMQRLKDAINQHLWSERAGGYAAYLYGPLISLRAPVADNLAQALAVLGGVADDDRAATLLAKTPIGHKGVTLIGPDNTAMEPYFSHMAWPAVQALWTIAAARQDNHELARRTMAALIRAQALYQSRHIALQGHRNSDLVTAASSVAVALRVLAGLHYVPDGIELHPMLPAALPRGIAVEGLHYRNAVLDITITGTGSNIASLTIDGEPVEGNFIPATLTGHHRVQAVLQAGHSDNRVTIATIYGALPATPDVVWTADSGCIVNYVAGATYRYMIDTQMSSTVSDMAFALPESSSGATQLAVIMAGRRGYGFMSRPMLITGSDSYTISLTPPPADTLAVAVNVSRSGSHLLQIDYRSTAPRCDALMVYANTHYQGTLLLPPVDTLTTSPSVTVNLLRGSNHLLLKRPATFAPVSIPVTLRIIKK
ncbi:MAG: hypothetical protein IKR25_10295 [Muribaculaceae bacterium]|nr:hypothetical protein [Muribaculaceae bacterium]